MGAVDSELLILWFLYSPSSIKHMLTTLILIFLFVKL